MRYAPRHTQKILLMRSIWNLIFDLLSQKSYFAQTWIHLSFWFVFVRFCFLFPYDKVLKAWSEAMEHKILVCNVKPYFSWSAMSSIEDGARSIRNLTMSLWPNLAAWCKHVHPWWSVARKFTPTFSNSVIYSEKITPHMQFSYLLKYWYFRYVVSLK